MEPRSYKASAPGTLMLFGEHAVLHNKPAIVAAIDQRLSATLIDMPSVAGQAPSIVIESLLGTKTFHLKTVEALPKEAPFEFVLSAISFFKQAILQKNQGFTLRFESDFSSVCGLGSSAAVVVATVAVLFKAFYQKPIALNELFEISRTIIRDVQGMGSGADVAASVYGGVIAYQQSPPFVLKKMDIAIPLVVIYSGSKTKTAIVVRLVEALHQQYPVLVNGLYETMGQLVEKALMAIHDSDWFRLGQLMKMQQGIMSALGVSTKRLNQLIDRLNEEETIFGAKISGSGLGDCVIGIGTLNDYASSETCVERLAIALSPLGMQYE